MSTEYPELLTELEAWQFLLAKWEDPDDDEYTYAGLCASLDVLFDYDQIHPTIYDWMTSRMERDQPKGKTLHNYWWKKDSEGREKRAEWIRGVIKQIKEEIKRKALK